MTLASRIFFACPVPRSTETRPGLHADVSLRSRSSLVATSRPRPAFGLLSVKSLAFFLLGLFIGAVYSAIKEDEALRETVEPAPDPLAWQRYEATQPSDWNGYVRHVAAFR